MGQVYDPILKKVITDVEADALNQQRRQHAAPTSVDLEGPMGSAGFKAPPDLLNSETKVDLDGGWGFLGLEGPNGQQQGVKLPPMAEEDARSILKMFPQAAGLIAQFAPGGKAASFAVPTIVSMIEQLIEGKPLDPLDASIEGAKGFAANRFGAGVASIGTKGAEKVTRALSLTGADKNDATIKKLTDLAIREGAEMTEDGAKAIRANAKITLPNGQTAVSQTHMKLADVLDNARLNEATAPNRVTFWPNEMAANYLRPAPRQLAIGRTMANPIGNLRTDSHIAPALEALMRVMMINNDSQPPMQTSRGPVRRPLR